jgi:hypothetical protein
VEGAGSRHLARARQALHAKIQLLLAPLVNRYATTPDLARRHRQLLAVTEEDDPAQGRNRAVGSLASAGRPRPAATTDRGGT